MTKISFSIYNKNHKYTGVEPCFYKTNELHWVKDLEDNWKIILEELNIFIAHKSTKLIPYFHKALIEQGNWKTFTFLYWSMKVPENYKLFPKTSQLFEKIPNLVCASFSMLEPNTIIAPHYGDTNAIMRGHLGIIIPDQLPNCGMKVGTEVQSWTNGKVMLFCDAHEHSAFNNTNQKRYIFLFDILKPEYARKKLYVCSGVLAQLSLFYLSHKLKIKKLPLWILVLFHKTTQIALMIVIPIKNKVANSRSFKS